jgi:hypothetical protein
MLYRRLNLADGEWHKLIRLPSTGTMRSGLAHDNRLPWRVHRCVRLNSEMDLLRDTASTFFVNVLLTQVCACREMGSGSRLISRCHTVLPIKKAVPLHAMEALGGEEV